MKKIFAAPTAVLALVSLSSSFVSLAQAATEAARVNDKIITLEEVSAKLAEAVHGNPMTAPSRKQVLDDLIRREVAVQEARKMKLEQDPVINERLNNVLFFGLVEKKLGPDFEKMTVTDAEAKTYYQKNPEIRTSHVFVALPPEATAEEESRASKKLNELSAEIKSGKLSFAEAAQKNSEDPSSSVGGDLDYRMKDRLDANFYRAATKLGKIGDITGPVRSSFGLHLIRLTGKHAWNEVDRTRVKKLLLEEKRQDLITRYLNDLRQKARVTVNDKVIKD